MASVNYNTYLTFPICLLFPVTSFTLLISVCDRMDVTLCAGHKIEMNHQDTGEFPQNPWRMNQKREMTTYYQCDLDVSEVEENFPLCDAVFYFRG